MRSIDIATDVFAAIWSARQEGEDTEDAILRRVLLGSTSTQVPMGDGIGVRDDRHKIDFPDGFRVTRVFKRIPYEAVARGGAWELVPGGVRYSSLNQLSRGIGAGVENAWRAWQYQHESGALRPVSELREKNGPGAEQGRRAVREAGPTWREDVEQALRSLGGKADLARIYNAVRALRASAGRSQPRNLEAVVRKELEMNSSDSEVFQGGRDLFSMPEGKGAGVWSVRGR